MIARLRDGTQVAAWMLKANPEVWDVEAALRDGRDLDTWRLAPSYRVELVAPGHPCVLWVTGTGAAAARAGVRALGVVTTDPYPDVGDPDDPAWGDPAAARVVRPYVGVHLEVLAEPLSRAEVRADPRLADLEVLRRPRMGSPLAVRADELAAMQESVGSR